jgi:NAD(P)-dependent dehydrogenase (short-subunit alcohol dehydrogenase family)
MTKSSDRGQLSGQVAIITGGSKGIGLDCARRFRAEGARVAITGRDESALEAARETLGDDVLILAGDASDAAGVEMAVQAVQDRFGRIDILVNNAGGPARDAQLVDLPLDVYDATISLNLRAPLVWTAAVWRTAMKDRGGVVVNMASTASFGLPPGMGVYAIAKAGLVQMTRVLAAELGPKVRVNGLAPGLVDTPATQSIFEFAEAAVAARMPLERLGRVADISEAALYLASNRSSWVTGHTLVVDGGSLVAGGRGAGIRATSSRDN